MMEFIGFLIGLGVGLIMGLMISFMYTQMKIARMTANFHSAAVAYATGTIKDMSLEALKRYLAQPKTVDVTKPKSELK